MKKSLLLVIIILSCLSANAQEESDTWVSVAKMDYVGIGEMPYEGWGTETTGFPYEVPTDATGKIEIVPEGVAFINPCMQDEIWYNCAIVLADFPIEDGHDYMIRLNLKVPSDGAYYTGFGNIEGEGNLLLNALSSRQVSVKGSDTFQIIDVEYPEYKCNAWGDGIVVLGCGWVVGTTILKEIELLERTGTNDIPDVKASKGTCDTLYNLAGQKVNAFYKGIVIKNGKKVVK